MVPANPFVIIGYQNPETFCDRENELKYLIECIENQRNILLYADRRIGKTGLIFHLFNHLEASKKWTTIYVDILPALTGLDFIQKMAQEIARKLAREKNILQKLMAALAVLRPKLSLDPQSGLPVFEIDYQAKAEVQLGLNNLLGLLNSFRKKVVIALDEFQQITEFQDFKGEAWVRSIAQSYAHLRFIYSGSKKHVLLSMFSEQNRPFYQSTQLMELGPLNPETYRQFILQKFKTNQRMINDEVIDFTFRVARMQTFYCQVILNRLFSMNTKTIRLRDVEEVVSIIWQEYAPIYFNYRNLITRPQWKLLTAIAKEKFITQPTAKEFINKYHLGADSSVSRALKALIEKGLVRHQSDDAGRQYLVEDALFSAWLERN